MTPTRNNGSSDPKNALPTRFGSLGSVKNAAQEKKLRRLLRKAGFIKRSGHALDKLVESIVLAICTGSKGTLEAAHNAHDPAVGCAASNATLNRVYGHADEEKVKQAMRSLLPGFRRKKSGVWIIDGTFLHVHGEKFELAARGYDSHEGKINLGYLLMNVIEMGSRKPVHWRLLPGNASEIALFQQVLAEAIEAAGEKPLIVVFDRGYVSKENLKSLDGLGIRWVSQANAGMKVSDSNRTCTPKDWFEYYEMGRSRKVYWSEYGSLLIVKDEKIEGTKLVDWRVLIGSRDLLPERIIALYKKRWDVEEYHNQLREIGLNELPTGKFAGLQLHVLLVVLAYLLLHCVETVLNCLGKSVETIIRAICVAGMAALKPQ